MHAPATEVGLVVGALGSSVARGKYSQLATDVAAGTDESEEEAASVATLLSGFLLGALVIEAARDCGTKTSEAFYRSFAQIDERVRHAFPCDINETAKAFILRFHSGEVDARRLDELLEQPFEQVVRACKAIVVELRIDAIEALGLRLNRPELAYKARTAYDGIAAFVRRNDPSAAEQLRIVGEQFRYGRMQLADVAKLMGLNETDAVFELEAHGFARPISVFGLRDEERRAILAEIRDDRMRRRGEPQPTPAHIDRDTIASERIESVDAREWIRRK